MVKTGHLPRQFDFRARILNHFTKLFGEMCVMHLKILADFSVFLKAMRYPVRHALNAELEPDSCSQVVLPITHFRGCTLACLQIRCLLIYQVNRSRIDGYCVFPMDV